MVSPKLGKPSIGRAGGAVGLQAGLKRIKGPNLWVLYGSPMAGGGAEEGWGTCVPNGSEPCVLTGRLCWDLAGYFLWPFGKVIQKAEVTVLPKSDRGVGER